MFKGESPKELDERYFSDYEYGIRHLKTKLLEQEAIALQKELAEDDLRKHMEQLNVVKLFFSSMEVELAAGGEKGQVKPQKWDRLIDPLTELKKQVDRGWFEVPWNPELILDQILEILDQEFLEEGNAYLK